MTLIHSLTREPYPAILFNRDKSAADASLKADETLLGRQPHSVWMKERPPVQKKVVFGRIQMLVKGMVHQQIKQSVRQDLRLDIRGKSQLPTYRARKSVDDPKSIGSPEEGECPTAEATTPIASSPRTVCVRMLSKAQALVMRRGMDIKCAAASLRKCTIVREGIDNKRALSPIAIPHSYHRFIISTDNEPGSAKSPVPGTSTRSATPPRERSKRISYHQEELMTDENKRRIGTERKRDHRTEMPARLTRDREQKRKVHRLRLNRERSRSEKEIWDAESALQDKTFALSSVDTVVCGSFGRAPACCHSRRVTRVAVAGCRGVTGAKKRCHSLTRKGKGPAPETEQTHPEQTLDFLPLNPYLSDRYLHTLQQERLSQNALALESSYASGQVKDTWAVLHIVCRRWYQPTVQQIMLTQGSVASDLRITDEHWDVDFARHLLERSIPYSIHLTMVLENRPRNAYTIQQLETFAEDVLINHRARIQSMVVGRSGFYANLNHLLLLAEFSGLRHLTIGSHLPKLGSLNADELSRAIPALNSLSLASTIALQQIPGKSLPVFPNLVTLELMGSPSKHDMTKISWDFLKVIGRIPALKLLVLSDYFPDTSRPSAIQPVVLPASINNLEYLSHKPARSVMDLDALLLHDGARRTVELIRTDPLTVVDVVTGALRNVEERAVKVGKGGPSTPGPVVQGADEQQSENDKRVRLEISITINRDQDVVDLRLALGVLSACYIRVKNVGDHLAFAIACIPVHAISKMFVYSDEPIGVLWHFLKQSETLVEMQVVGRSTSEFVKLFEQDWKVFPALRDVSLMDGDGFASTSVSLLRALARRHAEGVYPMDVLAIPETANSQCLTSFERHVRTVSYITKGEILRKGGWFSVQYPSALVSPLPLS
ncbi:hypothetical protein K488DRAFT_74732 [Vararia minispora EC-137]|uniref:Uncharacterized protein n=1 Tax=Vararia minispora EC-137 TaxID=1314806 RepID=A0ACB8Q6E1_9AGAM|nr:hypothetical protein K488DRAFT_74732 [Vararia minispora EC-137]